MSQVVDHVRRNIHPVNKWTVVQVFRYCDGRGTGFRGVPQNKLLLTNKSGHEEEVDLFWELEGVKANSRKGSSATAATLLWSLLWNMMHKLTLQNSWPLSVGTWLIYLIIKGNSEIIDSDQVINLLCIISCQKIGHVMRCSVLSLLHSEKQI